MFWSIYETIGLTMGLSFLLMCMVRNMNMHPDERVVTPFEMIMNMIMCIWMWPIQLMVWFHIRNDDDGPWSG